jgi:hypothetical protein
MSRVERSLHGHESDVASRAMVAPRRRALAVYVVLLVVAFVAPFAYTLRTTGVFGCPANPYSSSVYLAYCNTTQYGDYDYGAFWFELEPEIWSRAQHADVLFVGSSRSQFGFSAAATARWFEARTSSHYLLGFSHTTTARWLGPLIERLQPKAKAYVVNVDRLFEDRLPVPALEIFRDPETVRARYVRKRAWQYLHRAICGVASVLCGDHPAFYRSRTDGHWQVTGGSSEFGVVDVADGEPSDREQWSKYAALGSEFVAALPVDRRCVLLTIVPYQGTKREEAQWIANQLGLDLVAPVLDGLTTFDGSHLDPASAERWSAAFLEAAGPRLEGCLTGRSGSASIEPTTGG